MARSHPALPRRLIGVVVLLITALLLLTGETYPQTALSPASDVAQVSQDLFMLTVWLGLAVGLVVETMLVYTIIRYRRRLGDGRPKQVHGNTRLEIIWTVIPTILLAVIAVPTVQGIFATAATASANALHIKATGHQWWFEFRYTDLNITTANEIHVPAGRTVSFQLASADVMHSFWIPRMIGKRDMIPNHVNNIWFKTDRVGVYPGECAEFCGISHAHMSMKLFVDSPAAFAAWVKAQQVAAVAPTTALAQRGAGVFVSSGCIACHTLMGTIGQGMIGPNLSHVGGRSTIGAALFANTPANMAVWIHNSSAVKPGSLMPPQAVSGADLTALIAYLESRR